MHNLTTFTILDNGNLQIRLTQDGKEELNNLMEKQNLTDDGIFLELIEQHLCNGYSLVQPRNIGALTKSLILADERIDEDTTAPDINRTNIWWYPDYQVKSYLDDLQTEEGIIFTRA